MSHWLSSNSPSIQADTLTDIWAPLWYINTINKSAIMHPISLLRCHHNLQQQCLFFVSQWTISPLAVWFGAGWVYHGWQRWGDPSLCRAYLWNVHSCTLPQSSWLSFFTAVSHFIMQTQWHHMAHKLPTREDTCNKCLKNYFLSIICLKRTNRVIYGNF